MWRRRKASPAIRSACTASTIFAGAGINRRGPRRSPSRSRQARARAWQRLTVTPNIDALQAAEPLRCRRGSWSEPAAARRARRICPSRRSAVLRASRHAPRHGALGEMPREMERIYEALRAATCSSPSARAARSTGGRLRDGGPRLRRSCRRARCSSLPTALTRSLSGSKARRRRSCLAMWIGCYAWVALLASSSTPARCAARKGIDRPGPRARCGSRHRRECAGPARKFPDCRKP